MTRRDFSFLASAVENSDHQTNILVKGNLRNSLNFNFKFYEQQVK